MRPTPQVSPKKRKASEFEDDHKTNGSNTKRKGRPKKGSKSAETIELGDSPDPPFHVFCPCNAKDPKQKDASTGHAELADDFEWDYAVTSTIKGEKWTDIKSYKNVKCMYHPEIFSLVLSTAVTEQTFTPGDLIYILNNPNAPDPPSDDATEQEQLDYDRQNFYVGKIIQARAKSANQVYILIAYLYWPEEIPLEQRKQKNFYQGAYAKGELILSNDFAIIDATTISSKADILHWNEEDDSALGTAPERYWRQTFNNGAYQKNHKSLTALSELRKFCKCRRPHNPDKTMYHCSTGCKGWSHEQCLIDDIGSQVWSSYEKGEMDQYVKDNAPIDTRNFAQKVMGPVKNIAHKVEDKFEEILEQGVDAVKHEETTDLHEAKTNGSAHAKKDSTSAIAKKENRGRPRKTTWQSKLEIEIILVKDQSLTARIKEKSTKKFWQVKVNCLCCGQLLD